MEYALLALAVMSSLLAACAWLYESVRPKSDYDFLCLFTVPVIVLGLIGAAVFWALYVASKVG